MTLTVPEVLGVLALVLATAKFLASRLDSIRIDNTAAHAAITENVKESQRQIASLAAITENVKEGQRQTAASLAALTENVKESQRQIASLAAITENVKEGQRQTAASLAALTENVKENQRQIAALGARGDAIAVDVAFLRGRQEERDRVDHAAGG